MEVEGKCEGVRLACGTNKGRVGALSRDSASVAELVVYVWLKLPGRREEKQAPEYVCHGVVPRGPRVHRCFYRLVVQSEQDSASRPLGAL